jgi:protein ImuB
MRWIALQACSIEPLSSTDGTAVQSLGGAIAPQVISAAAVQQAICAIALSFTPRVALCSNAVVMEVSGSLRLFGGLHKLAALLEASLHTFFKKNSLTAHIMRAQAATSLIAIGRLRLLRAGQKVPVRVADMPLHTLAATQLHLGVLERTGCRSWGDLLALPRDGVARRFGAPLLAALDQARGALPEVYTWRTLPEQFEQKIELDALVIHASALMAGVDMLLVQLHAWLLGRQSGLCALKLVWHLDKRRDGPSTGELTVRTAQPAQHPKHVARLIAERLNQVSLSAPVHSITLASLETVSLLDAAGATASLLIEPRQQGASSTQLIERLSARLGSASVQMWQPQADHRPERMQRWVTLVASGDRGYLATESIAARARINSVKDIKGVKNATKNTLESSIRAEALFPTWLLHQPLKLASKAGAPLHQGPLVRLAGPQRLEATGWLLANGAECANRIDIFPALRDYFIYRGSQGVLLWIYSERLALTGGDQSQQKPAPQNQGQREWYLHGVFA